MPLMTRILRPDLFTAQHLAWLIDDIRKQCGEVITELDLFEFLLDRLRAEGVIGE